MTSIEVAMLWDVTAIEHSCIAMDRLVVVRKAVILLAWAVKVPQYHEL